MLTSVDQIVEQVGSAREVKERSEILKAIGILSGAVDTQ